MLAKDDAFFKNLIFSDEKYFHLWLGQKGGYWGKREDPRAVHHTTQCSAG